MKSSPSLFRAPLGRPFGLPELPGFHRCGGVCFGSVGSDIALTFHGAAERAITALFQGVAVYRTADRNKGPPVLAAVAGLVGARDHAARVIKHRVDGHSFNLQVIHPTKTPNR